MRRYAGAVLAYTDASDSALYLALDPTGRAVRCSDRLEELWWLPWETLGTAMAAIAVSPQFAPRLRSVVLQSYVVAVSPFLLDAESLTVRSIVSWATSTITQSTNEQAA